MAANTQQLPSDHGKYVSISHQPTSEQVIRIGEREPLQLQEPIALNNEFSNLAIREQPTQTVAPLAEPGKTPKDVNIKLDVHTDETGRKELDAHLHFAGKRDHKPEHGKKEDGPSRRERRRERRANRKDGKDDKDAKDDDDSSSDEENEGPGAKEKVKELVQTAVVAMAENTNQSPAGMVGAAVSAVGDHIATGGDQQKMEQIKNHGGVVGMVKQKVGEKVIEKAEDMKNKQAGEVVRSVPEAIKYHRAHAEMYHREGLIQEELANNRDLKRADRKMAKKKARELFEQEKVELSRAQAEERLLHATPKVEYIDAQSRADHKLSEDDKLRAERDAARGIAPATAAH